MVVTLVHKGGRERCRKILGDKAPPRGRGKPDGVFTCEAIPDDDPGGKEMKKFDREDIIKIENPTVWEYRNGRSEKCSELVNQGDSFLCVKRRDSPSEMPTFDHLR